VFSDDGCRHVMWGFGANGFPARTMMPWRLQPIGIVADPFLAPPSDTIDADVSARGVDDFLACFRSILHYLDTATPRRAAASGSFRKSYIACTRVHNIIDVGGEDTLSLWSLLAAAAAVAIYRISNKIACRLAYVTSARLIGRRSYRSIRCVRGTRKSRKIKKHDAPTPDGFNESLRRTGRVTDVISSSTSRSVGRSVGPGVDDSRYETAFDVCSYSGY